MTGLGRSVSRFNKKTLPFREPIGRKIDSVAGKTHFSPQLKQQAEPVIPLPDEEALQKSARKRRARRAGGRVSTVLSQESGGEADTYG